MPSTGGPSGSSGSGTGSTANVYTPTAQPQADQNFQSIIAGLLPLAMNAGAGTPAGMNYPTAQSFVQNYLTGSPYIAQAQQAGQTAGDVNSNVFYPQQVGAGQGILNEGQLGIPYGMAALQSGFDPGYGNIISQMQQNPYFSLALGGANQAADIGGQAASNLQAPAYSLLAGIQPMLGAAGTTLNTAFDPQQQLYRQLQGQSLDQSNVANAMAGVGNTPYGASVDANALNNFNLNWQNQQLGRQTQGLGAYDAALGQAGSTVGQAGNALAGAANLASSTSALPSNVYTAQLGNVLNALRAQGGAQAQGAGTFGQLLGGAGSSAAQGAGLMNTALQNYIASQQLPYNTGVNFANNAMSGLTNLTNLGNQQYNLPQGILGDLLNYMDRGQNASSLSGQLGQMGFNQLASGLGGGLAGVNSLFGQNSLLGGSGGLFGGGGLFGSGGLGGLFGGGGIGLDTGSVVGDAAAGGLFGGGADALLPFLAA